MGSQKVKKVSKKMTLKEARKITGGLEAWGTADPKKFYKNVQKELEDLFYADRIIYTWKNMGRYAMGMYDTPQEAMDILVANSNRPFKSGDVKRFYLVKYIEDQLVKKDNKDKGPRTIVVENLKVCSTLHGISYDRVGLSQTEINKGSKRKNNNEYAHDLVVEQIIEKRRRVLNEKMSEYKRWIKEEYRSKHKEFINFTSKLLLAKK